MKRFLAMGCICVFLGFAAAPAATAMTPAYTVNGTYANSAYHKRLAALPATGDPAFDAVAAAMSQLGYHEGDSRADFDGANRAGTGNFTEFCRAYGTVGGTYGYAWCAAFVSWCLSQAGAAEAAGGTFVSCTLWVERLQALGLYHTRASGYVPAAGDLVFFRAAGTARASDHVGLVRYAQNGRVFTVEGNAADSVSLHDYALSDAYIAGYGHPRYGGRSLGVSAHEADGTARGFYTVTNATLNVRAGRGAGFSRCGTLSRGALVEVLDVQNGWGAIRYGGKTAYISLSFAAFTAPVSYTVRYVDESGENAPRSATYWSVETLTAARAAPRAGYVFAGWQSDAGVRFAAGETLPAGDLTLTAVWQAAPTAEDEQEANGQAPLAAPALTEERETEPAANTAKIPSASPTRAETAAAAVTGALSLACGACWLWRRARRKKQ